MSPARPRILHLLGVSFRTAPVAVREALSFPGAEATAFLGRCSAWAGPLGIGLGILSTCNRTEFYVAGPEGSGGIERLLDALRLERPAAPISSPGCERYLLSGTAAARHLFRVASGLDSSVLGDTQILRQVKDCLATAAGVGCLGGFLHSTLVQAVQTGKQARRLTRIGHGSASIGSAIASMIQQDHSRILPDPAAAGPSVLILGAGEMARDIARHLVKRLRADVTFVNRTLERARTLAADCGGRALGWEQLEQGLTGSRYVIAAAACPRPILTRDMLDGAAMGNPFLRLVMDAGVPRNVEPGSRVRTLDIDSIREQQEEALDARRSAVPEVERIVDDAVRGWEARNARIPLERAIQQLFQEAADISRREIARFSGGDEQERRKAAALLDRSLKPLLWRHARTLRRASQPCTVLVPH